MTSDQARIIPVTREDPADGVSAIRKIAEGRQFALGHRDPAVRAASAGVFWAIWRDGCNYALTESSKMASLFHDVGEWIVLLGQARDAAPPVCKSCGAIQEDDDPLPEHKPLKQARPDCETEIGAGKRWQE
jgi:hypothetical protein